MQRTSESAVVRAAGFLWGTGVLSAAILAGFVVGTVAVLPFAVLPRGRRERWTIGGASAWAWIVLRLVVLARPTVTGEVRLAPGQGALLLSNHRSWLDPVLLMAYTRSNGLSKAEILWLPFIGVYGYLAGAVFFDRTDNNKRAAARAEVMKLVAAGHRIQIFPEGTRSRDGRLRERVYLRLAMDAWRKGVPVIPCAIVDTERALPANHFAAYPFREVRLDIGPALQPAEFDSARRFAEASWAAVCRRVAQLQTVP